MVIQNLNNKLSCVAFTVINFAPAGDVAVLMYDYKDIIYTVPFEGKEVQVKMIDLYKIPFAELRTRHVLPATGLTIWEWEKFWMEKNPATTNDTVMAIYSYRRCQ